MRIRVTFGAPDDTVPGDRTAPRPVEVLEGADEFLREIIFRLNEVAGKPPGRFVVSYVSGQPGARRPPPQK